VSFLQDQLKEGAQRISLPGIIVGQSKLYTGDIVPVVQPDIRGMFSWKTSALAAIVNAVTPPNPAPPANDVGDPLQEFLNRVYDETENLGLTSQDRARNYAATDALVVSGIFNKIQSDFKGQYVFDTYQVNPSAICRPDADCWDVVLYFYDPTNLMTARRAVRYTIDVTDVVPVITGTIKEFTVR
jgi:PatG C-terminal